MQGKILDTKTLLANTQPSKGGDCRLRLNTGLVGLAAGSSARESADVPGKRTKAGLGGDTPT